MCKYERGRRCCGEGSVLDRGDTGWIGFGLAGADDHESGMGRKRGGRLV
jgi:hypothetical protein